MKEEAFRQQVRQIARLNGWAHQYHTHNSKFSDAGWPDEVLASEKHKRIIFIELKSDTGRIRPAQKEWIRVLQLMGLEAAIWRPRDMDHVLKVLGKDQVSLHEEYVSPRKKPGPKPKTEDRGWVFGSELKTYGTQV